MSANNMAASCRIVQRYNNEEKANRFTNKMIYPNPFLPLSVPKLSEGEGGAFFKLEEPSCIKENNRRRRSRLTGLINLSPAPLHKWRGEASSYKYLVTHYSLLMTHHSQFPDLNISVPKFTSLCSLQGNMAFVETSKSRPLIKLTTLDHITPLVVPHICFNNFMAVLNKGKTSFI